MKAPLVVKDPDDRGKSRSNVHPGVVHCMAERLEHDGQIYEAPVWIRNQHEVSRGGGRCQSMLLFALTVPSCIDSAGTCSPGTP